MAEESNKLLIEVQAKVDGLEKGLKDSQKKIDEFAVKAEEAAKKVGSIGKESESATGPIDNLASAMEKAGGKTGDFGRKMKAMLSGIKDFGKGFAGMAPSIATATTLIGGVFAAALAIGTIALIENKDAILEAVFGINDLTKAYDAAAKSIGKQIGRLESLVVAYNDSNTSEDDKLAIQLALQKEFPEYFRNLGAEKAGVLDVGKAYDQQTDAIIGLGIIKELQEKKNVLLAERAKLRLKKELTVLDRFKQAVEIIGNTVGPVAGLTSLLDVFGDPEGYKELTDEIGKLDTQIKDVKEEFNVKDTDPLKLEGFRKKVQKTKDDLEKLRKKFLETNNTIASSVLFESNIYEKGFFGIDWSEKARQVGQFGKAIKDVVLNISTGPNPFTSDGFAADDIQGPSISGTKTPDFKDQMANIDRYYEYLKDVTGPIREQMINLVPDPTVLGGQAEEAVKILREKFDTMADNAKNFAAGVQQAVRDLTANLVTELFTSIGEAIGGAEGAMGGAGERMLKIVGGFLSQLGQMMITFGTTVIAFDLATKNLSIGAGIALIVAGGALVAIGAAIRAKAKKGPTGGGSSRSYSGSTAGSGSGGYSGGSRSSANTGPGGGTYVFEIEGTKLVGVLSRTLNRNKALGGSLSIG